MGEQEIKLGHFFFFQKLGNFFFGFRVYFQRSQDLNSNLYSGNMI